MKSYCKGLEITEDVVAASLAEWMAGKAGRKNAHRIPIEHGSAQALASEITREIRERDLHTRPITYRMRREPNHGKERLIAVESVKQQVLDYTAVHCLRPLIDAKLGYYQASSVEGKGQVWLSRRLKRWSGECRWFVKTDFRKCYPSTPVDKVMRMLRKYVRSDDVLYLCGYLMGTYRDMRGTDGVPADDLKRGLNIGSYFSLMMELLVLSFAYHFVEGLRKERRGASVPLVSHQAWFMDDCTMFGDSKRDLKMAVRKMGTYMRREFGLELKPWKVCKLTGLDGSERVSMAGYRTDGRTVTVSGGTFVRLRRAFRRVFSNPNVVRRACSYWGWLKHSDSWRFVRDNGIRKAMRLARATVSAEDRRVYA